MNFITIVVEFYYFSYFMEESNPQDFHGLDDSYLILSLTVTYCNYHVLDSFYHHYPIIYINYPIIHSFYCIKFILCTDLFFYFFFYSGFKFFLYGIEEDDFLLGREGAILLAELTFVPMSLEGKTEISATIKTNKNNQNISNISNNSNNSGDSGGGDGGGGDSSGFGELILRALSSAYSSCRQLP